MQNSSTIAERNIAAAIFAPRTGRLLTAITPVLTLLVLGTQAQAQCGSPPTCFGQPATIYVSAGIICGGPNNLQPYVGTLSGTSSEDIMVATEGADTMVGSGSNDLMCGLGGNDHIDAGAGDDQVDAGDGDDVVVAGANADFVLGGRGNDNINGGSGADTLCGQNDDD